MRGYAWVCVGMREYARVCASIRQCARVCASMHVYARVVYRYERVRASIIVAIQSIVHEIL